MSPPFSATSSCKDFAVCDAAETPAGGALLVQWLPEMTAKAQDSDPTSAHKRNAVSCPTPPLPQERNGGAGPEPFPHDGVHGGAHGAVRGSSGPATSARVPAPREGAFRGAPPPTVQNSYTSRETQLCVDDSPGGGMRADVSPLSTPSPPGPGGPLGSERSVSAHREPRGGTVSAAMAMSEWEFWGETPPSQRHRRAASSATRSPRIDHAEAEFWGAVTPDTSHGIRAPNRAPELRSWARSSEAKARFHSQEDKTKANISFSTISVHSDLSSLGMRRTSRSSERRQRTNLPGQFDRESRQKPREIQMSLEPSSSPRFSSPPLEEVWARELRRGGSMAEDPGNSIQDVSVLGSTEAWVSAHLAPMTPDPKSTHSPATVGDDTEVSNLVAQLLRMRQDKLALQAELEMEKSQANHFREGLRKHKHAGFVRLWLKSIKTCGLSALWAWHEYVFASHRAGVGKETCRGRGATQREDTALSGERIGRPARAAPPQRNAGLSSARSPHSPSNARPGLPPVEMATINVKGHSSLSLRQNAATVHPYAPSRSRSPSPGSVSSGSFKSEHPGTIAAMKRTPNAYIVCKYCTFSGPAILVLDTGPLHDVGCQRWRVGGAEWSQRIGHTINTLPVEPKLIPVSGKINDACWDGELVEDRGRSTQDRFPRNKLHQSSFSRSAADTDRINKKLRACANFLQEQKEQQLRHNDAFAPNADISSTEADIYSTPRAPHDEDFYTTLNLPPPPPSPPVAASRHDSLGVTMPHTARSSAEWPQQSHPSPHAAWPRRPDSGNVVMAKVGEAVSNLSLLSSYEAFSARNTRSSFVSVASTMSDLVSVASDESDAQCRTEGARAPADNAGEGASREAALLPSDAKAPKISDVLDPDSLPDISSDADGAEVAVEGFQSPSSEKPWDAEPAGFQATPREQEVGWTSADSLRVLERLKREVNP